MTVTINGSSGITAPEVILDNTTADGGQVVLKSSGYSNWNLDNYSGRFRAYYNSTEQFSITNAGLFQFNSGYGSVATAYGCRAWVNFNGTGTVAIRASGNVSSITDLAAGEYQVNFTTAMPDANYSTNVTSSTNSGYDSDGFSMAAVLSNLTTPHVTTTSVRVGTALAANGNGSDGGAVCMNVSIFR